MLSPGSKKNLREGKMPISISTCSEGRIVREYNDYSDSTARDVYQQALKEISEAVRIGRKDSLVRYAKLIARMNGMKSKETLKSFFEDACNPLKDTNLIILACKHNQVGILECLMVKESWILNCLSIDVGNVLLSMGDKDGECHGCFYYAIRSGNVKLLDTLVINYKPTSFKGDGELDVFISRSYEELKLRNVPISLEMEFYVETKLVDLRFFSVDDSGPASDSAGNIDLQIGFVLDCVRLLKEDYADKVTGVDGKFLYVAKSIAENIHALKQQLKWSYDRIPWEEMEFCLVCFISSRTKRKEVNLYFRSALNLKKILYHLDNFAKCLEDFKRSDWKNVEPRKRFKLPQMQREKVVAEITGNYPQFSELYGDYGLVRDAYTLEELKRYVDIAVRADHKTMDGRLIITRALQVVGEHLKNTLASPKLSRATGEVLSLLVPHDTREIITEVRDSLSHKHHLLRKGTDAKFYGNLQEDLKKIGVAVVDILYRNKIKTVYSLLKRFVDSESLDVFKELADVMECVKLVRGKLVSGSVCRTPTELKTIEELVRKLGEAVNEKTDYEKQLFLKIDEILNSEGKKVEETLTDYYVGLMKLKNICETAEYGLKMDENLFQTKKYSTNEMIRQLSAKRKPKELNQIAKLCMKIAGCALPRMQLDRREELLMLIYDMNHVIDFEMNNIKWIEEFGTMLSKFGRRSVTKSCRQNSTCSNEAEHAQQLGNKICALKDTLKRHGFGSARKREEFPAKTCVGKMEVAIEMLLLDILSVLGESRLSNNQVFANDYVPLLTGKRLRNHLAHGNTLMNVLPFSITWTIIGNAEKLSAEELVKDCRKIGRAVKFDHKRLEDKFNQDLAVISNQERMFASLEEGNIEELRCCLKLGADLSGRSSNSWSASHYAAKGPSLEIAEFVMRGKANELDVTLDSGQTPFHIAAAYGRKYLVKYLLEERKLDINLLDYNGNTPLHIASLNGHLEVVRILLRNGADSSKKDGRGMSALHCAVRNGHTAVAKVLLKLEGNVNLNQAMGSYTTLYAAVEFGNSELVDHLLRIGANPNIRSDRGTVPLHSAALYGHVDIVKALLLHGADVNLKGIDGCTPLRDAAENGHEEIVELLLESGCNVNNADKMTHSTPLFYAAAKGFTNTAKILLKYGCDVNAVDAVGKTCLQVASECGYEEVVQLLLRNGALVDAADEGGSTSLHRCSFNGHVHVARILLRWGANVNSKDLNGRNPLYLAVVNGQKDIVEVLVSGGSELVDHRGISLALLSAGFNQKQILQLFFDLGVPVDIIDEQGLSPLHVAVSNEGNIAVVEYLLSKGAKVNSKNGIGVTPLHLASLFGAENIVGALIEAGADVNSGSLTPLYLATQANHIEIVESLIANGAELNTVNEMGLTPLCVAVKQNYKRIAKFLISKGADVNLGQPLVYAVLQGHNKILADLLKVSNIKLDIQLSDVQRLEIVRVWGDFTGQGEAVDALLEKGSDFCKILDLLSKSNESKVIYPVEELDKIELLPLAAGNGNVYAVQALLEKGMHPDCSLGCKITALCLAALNNHSGTVEILLSNGANVNLKTKEGDTALHLAAPKGHIDVVEVLLSHAADVNMVDGKNRTPLEMAVAHGRVQVVRTILQQCSTVRIDAKGNDGWTLLHIAAQAGELEIVKLILDKGADWHCTNSKGSKPIHIAARQGHSNIVAFFIENGFSISEKGAAGWTLLHYASTYGCIEVGKYLIGAGYNVNSLDNMGRTPLHVAADGGRDGMIEFLLKSGAMYNPTDAFGRKPVDLATCGEVTWLLECTNKLFAAVKKDELPEVVSCIREGGAINGKNVGDWTVLHHASWKGHEKIVRVLLKNKANPNVVGKGGCTPLHYAAKFNHLGIVKALLAHGAVYNLSSSSSKTPLEFTTDKDIVVLLKLVDRSFKSVRNGDSKFLECLKKVKDVETAKALMNCLDGGGLSLIVAAIRDDFPKIRQLKETFLEDTTDRRNIAELMLQGGKYKVGMHILQKILEESKEILGPENPATLDIRSDIAKALYRQNNYVGALRELRDVHAKLQSILGSKNKDVLSAKSFIALILHRLGENREAINIFEEVCPIQKEILGEDDPEVLETCLHKALVLDHLDRYEEALELNYDLLERHEAIYGSRHQSTLSVRNNIAIVLGNLERYAEAFEIYEFVHKMRKSILGPENPITLRTFHNMAMLLIAQGRLEKAREMLEEVFERQTSVLGAEHLETLSTQYHLGNVLLIQGMDVRALKVYTEGLDRRRAILGTKHPEILDTFAKIKYLKMIFKMKGQDDSKILHLLQDDIFAAAGDGNVKIVEGLIKNLKDPNSVDSEGRTPMHFAVSGGHANVVSVLLKHGGDSTKTTAKGNTVLHMATLKRNREMVELLLRHGKMNLPDKMSDFVNAKTNASGSTALHIASKSGCYDIAKSLLEHGATYNPLDKIVSRKPSDYCTDENLSNLFRTIDHLFSSALGGDTQITEKLKKISPEEFSPILNARNGDGQTAIQVAIANKHKGVAGSLIKLLKEHHAPQSGQPN